MADHAPDAPEFQLVVRRASSRGPIAPYRFAITILFAALVAGVDLWEAVNGLRPPDPALIKAAIAGLMSWVVLGLADSILRAGRATRIPIRTEQRPPRPDASPGAR